MITLVKDTIGNEDIDRLVEWLKTYPRLTKGPITLDFEKNIQNGWVENILFLLIQVHQPIF